MTSDAERDRPAGSYSSFGPIKEKNKVIKCNSQPFLKPTFAQGAIRFMKKVSKILHSKSVDPTAPEPVDFTLDESKLILREIAQELDRILQTRALSLSTNVGEDGSSLEERQAFLLQLAQNLPQRAHAPEKYLGQSAVLSPCSNGLEENRGEACTPKPEGKRRLKKAISDLSTWTWTLRGMEDDSVCLDTDVDEVVKEMCKLWKKGKLPNILPVLNFVILSILQQEGQKLSIVKHWNRNQELFNTDPQHAPDSVWKWITKTRAEVRLDPSTANPCLKISPDGRAVTMDEIVESVYDPWKDFRRTKHRYDGWWCVLGREGFASGRHYWEVDVRGKKEWRMGVVRESAPRNGFKSLNEKTYHWTLKLQLGRLMAMTVPVTKLARCAPSVLGVFLDMEEGNVSFYDVTNRLHIYSFNVSFDLDEKIFPVFGTVETGREMRILN
ncbi:E3 ubiquitin-protein ligase TRIM39-like isoform X2 [Gadus macrocephalus]|uniref:E3 ubiquitin-protein ligase TRIM39-like isoform X2 n=1 Tax=Gadus macrocephalus TaxID=80720 RepID=UPI0028CBB5DE|nr:E3 ubiquitin-protein ligase TRIM39-like isoform X2 [Gadus macrocephalus]